MRRSLWALAALLTVVGCEGNGTLQGSIGELFSLEVSNEAIERNSEAFQVTYLHNQATAQDIVVQLSVALTGVNFQPGATVDLTGEYAPSHPRCVVIHHADGEPERDLPYIKSGTLKLSGGGDPGQGTSGNFTLSFGDDAGYGAGRTLLGSFNALATDAGF